MKHILLSIMCVCTSLAQLAFADTQVAPKQHQLQQPAILKLWTRNFDWMVELRLIHALVALASTLAVERQYYASHDYNSMLQAIAGLPSKEGAFCFYIG